ncbi:MAG TPA: sigma-70 family RNA polymerase sigma factor [Phycicoccus sp.]|nr:sigma-70 family RNA polymerase sigma factor [Phycicoccus sp.]HQK30138.1 sigma-70 family RNA polymerase sigma factor [Phycicoccus sp.]HQV91214.1 sigma-70 family RNA polymerase sigma factor [Phycicoccus sp.]HQY95570.1 sigma-70 family RNA polymerase sigma factor [Phycicoccus sp.]HRA43554.1 sigma-70 family RNA polymerase sigma factor [Phycicoccus sp.]
MPIIRSEPAPSLDRIESARHKDIDRDTHTDIAFDWVAGLNATGREREDALRRLHALMVRAAGHQVWRLRGLLADDSPGTIEDIVNLVADDAMTALLGKLDTFEGRSRFTTWAFKFAIYQAGNEVRRRQWQHRQVELRDVATPADPSPGPEHHAEAGDLAVELSRAMHAALTPHQRRIAVALLVDEVPIDVLAERLATTRGALYKTLHDVRSRLRAHLVASGHLDSQGGIA